MISRFRAFGQMLAADRGARDLVLAGFFAGLAFGLAIAAAVS